MHMLYSHIEKTDTDCSAYQELEMSDLHICVQLSGKKIELQSTQDVTKYWQDQFDLEVRIYFPCLI